MLDIGAHNQDLVNGVFCEEEYGAKNLETDDGGGDALESCVSRSGAQIRCDA